MRARWRCPAAGHRPDPAALDAGCRKARREVAAHVGCPEDELGPSCPLADARAPWVLRVARDRKWAERGLLAQYEGALPAQLFEALDVLDEALAAKDARDQERREAAAAAKRAGDPRRLPLTE